MPSARLGAGDRCSTCPQIFHRSVVAGVMPAGRELQGNAAAGLRKAFQRRHLSFFKDELQVGEERGDGLTGIPAPGNSLAKERVRSGWARKAVVRREAAAGAWGHTEKGS